MSSYLIYIYLTFAREEEYVVHNIALFVFVTTFSLVFFVVFFFFKTKVRSLQIYLKNTIP